VGLDPSNGALDSLSALPNSRTETAYRGRSHGDIVYEHGVLRHGILREVRTVEAGEVGRILMYAMVQSRVESSVFVIWSTRQCAFILHASSQTLKIMVVVLNFPDGGMI
jgi:hypothetical protein